ncbi:MAG: L-idonate 5-dehydrogenase [Geminicoccales bacterium]
MQALQIHAAKDLRLAQIEPRSLAADEVRVAIKAGGICGSDLSYYFKGRVGDFAVREPLILGHEVAGEIAETGNDVKGFSIGDAVAINPSRPCLTCTDCLSGRGHLCREMLFYGSAARMPHVQGAFSDLAIARVDQCHLIPSSMSFSQAAMAEPLAVALHAVKRAGDMLGRRVMIAGAGPIGLLVALSARQAGAAEISIFDLAKPPLRKAEEIGVDAVYQVGGDDDPLQPFEANKGTFDIAFEATGALPALASLLRVTRPGGRVVQIGMLPPGQVPVAANLLMAQEIDYLGSFRFHEEYKMAVDFLANGRIDVGPLITCSYGLEDADAAFVAAADRDRNIKVQLRFDH